MDSIKYKGIFFTKFKGFHEAIGDVISLSVATTKHMIKLGLMNDAESSNELTVNYLMKMALEKVKLGVQSSGPYVYIFIAFLYWIFIL